MPIALLAAAALLLAAALRRRLAHHFETAVGARRAVGADGIIPGAQPIDLPGRGPASPAVLLIHGGGDTPQTMVYLAAHLEARGYAVRAPLLPGHGRTLREFSTVRADRWLDAVRAEYATLRRRHDWVAVIGLSMGGALAVRLAAEIPDLPALGLVAPYLAMSSRVAAIARSAPAWGLLVPYVPSRGRGRSIHDPEEAERNLAYGVFSAAFLRALWLTVRSAAAALPRVTAPTILVQSREDNRISVPTAERAIARLGAGEKRLVLLEGTGHIITVDRGRERVLDVLTEWLDTHREKR